MTTQAAADEAGAVESTAVGATGRSQWVSAWLELRRNPLFWISAALILLFTVMAIAPQLFTSADPRFGELSRSRQGPSSEAIFGYDQQGYDIFARTVYGARASMLVGVLGTAAATAFGMLMGLLAGFFGGWLDAVLQRLGEIFFGIPLLLGGMLFLYQFPTKIDAPLILQVGKIVLILTIIGWPTIARLMRSAVLQVKPQDYVQAARGLGASPVRIIVSHVMPNAIAPVIVVATINLGVYIGVEATLSFLTIGLQPPAISWGVAISDASRIGLIQSAPHMLLFPSLFLSLTVLAFILLGDAVRDAFDPKLR